MIKELWQLAPSPKAPLWLVIPRVPFMAIGGLPEVRQILGLRESSGVLSPPELLQRGSVFRFLSSLFRILLQSSVFFVCRRFSPVSWHFLSPAAVFLPEKVSPVTFSVTRTLAGNFFSIFLLSVKINLSSGRLFCSCSLLLCSISSSFIFFLKPTLYGFSGGVSCSDLPLVL